MDDHPQITIVVQNLIFCNTPSWIIIRICLIKTLLGKTQRRKKNTIFFFWYIRTVSLKTLPVKPSRTKPRWRKKECSIMIFLSISSPSCRHGYIFSSSTTWRSLSPRIPMSFLSIAVDNTFVYRFTKLPLDLIHRIEISSLFWS